MIVYYYEAYGKNKYTRILPVGKTQGSAVPVGKLQKMLWYSIIADTRPHFSLLVVLKMRIVFYDNRLRVMRREAFFLACFYLFFYPHS